MSIRHLLTAVAAALFGAFALATPALADVSIQPAAASYGLNSGRLGPTVTALVGLAGVIIGGLALRSADRIGSGPLWPIAALVAGLISMVLGAVFAVTADGGPGTGNGIVGAIVAVVLGLISTLLGGLAMARSRRNT
jgi:hypothetical protein